eukprot:10836569-Heterocapsa_arctica.AAC.1
MRDSPKVHGRGLFPSLPEVGMFPRAGGLASTEDPAGFVDDSQAVGDNGNPAGEVLRHVDDCMQFGS